MSQPQSAFPAVAPGAVVAEISMSLDGYVSGPDDGVGKGLGEGGEVLHLHVAPVLLGAGRRPFAGVGRRVELEPLAALQSPYATHLRYRVLR